MSEIFSTLNDRQISAVKQTDGPLLIIAGAGSGKTRTLTHRIAYLIKEKNVPADQILAVTFTNKAAEEMKKRVQELTEIQFRTNWGRDLFPPNVPVMGTFHSICARILRYEIENLGRKRDFVIFDTLDTASLMRQILKDFRIDEKKFHYKAVLGHISRAKNELIDESKYADYADNFFRKTIWELYQEYQKRLFENNALDFDDLIMLTIKIFQNFPKSLAYYQDRWRYIAVDEYQDTNFSQYVLINMLAKKYRNLCVIGDSDQSIYSFRGADIRNILSFEQDYPEAKIIKLEQNYRSTSVILNASDRVISKNKNRPQKEMWTDRDGGEKISVIQADSERHEAEIIATEIRRITQYDNNYGKFVVLYRTNAQSRAIEESMLRFGIPYKVIGGVKFYARREIKDILAYLRVIHNSADTVSLLRIINVPSRKIGEKTVNLLIKHQEECGGTVWDTLREAEEISGLSPRAKKVLAGFYKLMQAVFEKSHSTSVSELIQMILDQAEYRNYLLAEGTEEGKVRLENVLELISVAQKYDGLQPREALATFLEEVALVADVDSVNQKENAVTLMTLHTAKGLEFPYVFIAGCEENIFPHARSLFDEEQLAEERRLMYVGMTRAEDKLYLLAARRRMIFGEFQCNSLSRFLADVPDECTEDPFHKTPEREGALYQDEEYEYDFDQEF